MLVVRGLAHRACPPVMIFELIKVLGLWKVRQAHTLQVVSSTTFPSALLAPHMGVLERPPSRGGGGETNTLGNALADSSHPHKEQLDA